MLELRPDSQCCDVDLTADSPLARVRSFKCTFCAACAQDRFLGLRPNCGGGLVSPPVRPEAALAQWLASTGRVNKAHAPCV